MCKNILTNHSILLPHSELTKPQPKRHEFAAAAILISVLYLYGDQTMGNEHADIDQGRKSYRNNLVAAIYMWFIPTTIIHILYLL